MAKLSSHHTMSFGYETAPLEPRKRPKYATTMPLAEGGATIDFASVSGEPELVNISNLNVNMPNRTRPRTRRRPHKLGSDRLDSLPHREEANDG